MLFFSLIPGAKSSYANENSVRIDSEFINMRSGPGLSFEITGTLNRNDQAKIISTSGDWLEVTSSGQKGWIASWLTAPVSKSSVNLTIVSQVNSLNIRTEPSIGSAILGKLNAGDEAVLIEKEGDWARITKNKVTGWVHTDYISEIGEQNNNVPEKTTKAMNTFTVSVDSLNVRSEASLASKKIGVIQKDKVFNVKEVNGNWVKISLDKKKEGWVYSFHGLLSSTEKVNVKSETKPKTVTILTNGTNIREKASTNSAIAYRANAGQQFEIKRNTGDWFEILMPSGETAFIANWVVSANEDTIQKQAPAEKKKARVAGTLNGLTIVIDPGHGGNDRGTTGQRGTDEKYITLLTAELLASKLKAAGATVELTRETDTYVTLRKRVATSHQYAADAFVSIHYDATLDSTVSGFTTYYSHKRQKGLGTAINNELDASLSIRNRGVQPGNYFVLRENSQNAILIELGYLSNASEERYITTAAFREQATHGIYNGLLKYFDAN